MNTFIAAAPSIIDRVKRNLVELKMPRALEILDVTLRGIERGEITALEALDTLLAEELALRENPGPSGPSSWCLYLPPAYAGEVAVHQIRAPPGAPVLVGPAADTLQDQQPKHDLRRRFRPAT